MANSAPPTEPCKLCGNTALLQWSHIVPRWTYKRIIKGNPPGFPPSPVRVANGSAAASPHQEAEYMLCRTCEELLSDWEKYVASIALQEDDSFPALAKTSILQMPPGFEWKVGDAARLETEKIARFATSVIWRASVSTIFQEVTLGNKYNRAFATYLLGDSQFPAQACLLVEFMNPQDIPRVDRNVVHPESQKNGSYHCHQFCAFGIWFRLFVGGQLPASISEFSFVEKKRVLLSDGTRLLRSVAQAVKRATPKGRLVSK